MKAVGVNRSSKVSSQKTINNELKDTKTPPTVKLDA